MLDLKSLSTFIQVAELNSFTRAAEKLGYSQPTISVQIKQLETELGVKLFERIGHTVRLTERGRDILPHAQRIYHMCEEMAAGSKAPNEVRGTIRLGMADSLCSALISRGFSDFREMYPHIALNVTPAGTNELFRLLDHNEVDMVCTLDSHIYNMNYVVANEEKIGVHFVVPAGHPLADCACLTEDMLSRQPFLLTEKGMSYRRLLDERLAQDGIELQPILEVGSADLICELVEKGIGISFLPDYITESAAARGTVVRLDLKDFEPDLWKQLLYHRDKWISPHMQAVLNQLSGILLNNG